jgi:hypothetical protein
MRCACSIRNLSARSLRFPVPTVLSKPAFNLQVAQFQKESAAQPMADTEPLLGHDVLNGNQDSNGDGQGHSKSRRRLSFLGPSAPEDNSSMLLAKVRVLFLLLGTGVKQVPIA